MGKYVMVVQSRAKEGRAKEYDEWYDTTHFFDICAIPGVKSGRRFDATPIHMGPAGLPCLAIFEIETEDPSSILTEMGKRSAAGQMKLTDALDAPATVLWIYELHEVAQPASQV
jgi:hypothetical protein